MFDLLVGMQGWTVDAYRDWLTSTARARAARPLTDPVDSSARSGRSRGATIRRMLDHEEKFLFKEEILHLANAVAEPGILDNVEDLLTDVITSPRFD